MGIGIKSAILGAAVAAVGFSVRSAGAAVIAISTSGGTATDNTFTVNDPDVGPYTVTVAGYQGRTLQNANYYYRNSSTSGASDIVITWTVSGLDPSVGTISDFRLNTVTVAPSVGSGNANYIDTLSAPDTTTSSSVTATQTVSAGTADKSALEVAGSFGSTPVFSLAIDKQTPYTSRAIGERDFTITAVPVPEPVSAGLLAGLGVVGLRRRRRGC